MSILPGNVEYFTISIDGLTDTLRVVNLQGTESISSLYRFDLELISENAELDFDQVIGKPGLITFYNNDREVDRYIHGVVNRFSQSRQGRRFTTYHIELVPVIWNLSCRSDVRIFQGKTVKEILAQVLEGASIPPESYSFALQGHYDAREYCVQYRESDLDFISRLMEDEGIFYFFEHKSDKHVLNIADNASVHEYISDPHDIRFHVPTGLNDPDYFISQFNYTREIRPGRVSIKDYNYSKPALDLMSNETALNNTELEIYDYPSGLQTAERNNRLSRVRLEEQQSTRIHVYGNGTCKTMMPGYRFYLNDYPREEFNMDYIITSISHTARQPNVLEEEALKSSTEYHNDFRGIPVESVFRPARVTRRPVVEGVQTAIVVGPEGEEIYVDEYGRVKIQFHWDREGEYNENSSCWIRVSQISAGTRWGAMFIPRIGQEVVVNFVGGDPDRPIITGCVYHGTNKPPYDLPENKTRCGIKTNSSKGGEGFNELRFEDKIGEEEIYLHAQKDMKYYINNNKYEGVVMCSYEKVGVQKDVLVAGGYYLSVGVEMNEKVLGDRKEDVAGGKTIYINKNLNVKVNGDQKYENEKKSVELIKDASIHKANNIYLESNKKIEFKVGGSSLKIDKNGISLNSNKININGNVVNMKGSGLVNIKGAMVRIN